jgi:hypothetical protein
MLYFSLIIYFR